MERDQLEEAAAAIGLDVNWNDAKPRTSIEKEKERDKASTVNESENEKEDEEEVPEEE